MSVSEDFSEVEKMLKKCAPGHTVRVTTHSRQIRFDGKVYPSLPKHKTIEHGYIRKLISFLGLSVDCAAKYLPNVRFREETARPQTQEMHAPAAKQSRRQSSRT